mmetsp:Transcript_13803/g.44230  ORF Transcript_13803/g.44230 Transcript_13803/m.44230 type:complete len:323 (+) Transcript_13803:822-1790(+)
MRLRAPRGRAVQGVRRQAGPRARHAAGGARHCGRLRGARVRDGGAQGDAGARRQRLRHRPAARPAPPQHPEQGRDDERGGRQVRWSRPVRVPYGAVGGPRGGGARAQGGGAHAAGASLAAVGRGHRAARLDAVVRQDEGDGGQGARGGAVGRDQDPARALREGLLQLARKHPRLVRLAPALVGPPHPGLVRRLGAGQVLLRALGGGGAQAGRGRARAGGGAAAGRRRARHVVLVRAVALRDRRLAAAGAGRRPDGRRRASGLRPGALLPVFGDGDGVRHPLLLGRAHDDARPRVHRQGALPHHLPARPSARRKGPKDEQDQG